jgi:hypothetical protein
MMSLDSTEKFCTAKSAGIEEHNTIASLNNSGAQIARDNVPGIFHFMIDELQSKLIKLL